MSKHGLYPNPMEDLSDCLPPKSGKVQSCEPQGYKPISLTSFILKTLEKLLDLQIRNDVGRLMSFNQHAYTKVKSVETALHSLVTTVERALHIKEKALGAFVDISGAFNNVNGAFDNVGGASDSAVWSLSVVASH
ncbi:uncharacterized protein [Drosophila takahashii]|uniref:uncharacterized protein n=1 Tax=Drosophila takahashii TaxID=29030 RepID=UPI003898DA90